jgi:predicted AlkP superfamily pyrophosphatase or phosphodiesterase
MPAPTPGLELAHEAGHRTAIFYSWESLRDVTRPGSLSYAAFTAQKYILPQGDVAVLEEALRYLSSYLSSPQDGFMFVYFGNVDTAGEEHGFMSEPYLAQVEIVDQLLGRLLGSLPAGTTFSSWQIMAGLIMITGPTCLRR